MAAYFAFLVVGVVDDDVMIVDVILVRLETSGDPLFAMRASRAAIEVFEERHGVDGAVVVGDWSTSESGQGLIAHRYKETMDVLPSPEWAIA